MALEYLMLLTDSIIIGNIFGEQAIAASNLVNPIFSVAVFVSTLISIGTSVSYSFEMGKFQKEEADRLFGQGVILAVGAGIVLFALAFFGKNLYFRFMAPSEIVEGYARDYYLAYQFVMLLYPIYALLIDMVYSDGDELVCNISYAVQVFVNIPLSIFLCKRIGIVGASTGTLVGTTLSIMVLLSHFFRKQNSLRFVPGVRVKAVIRVVKYSVIDASLYLFVGLTFCIATKYVIAHFGDYYLPVMSVVISVIELTVVFDGIGQAITPLLNVYRGENNQTGIRKVMRVAFRSAVAEGLAATVLLFVFGGFLANVFGITDPVLLAQCQTAARLICLSMTVTAILFLFTTYYLLIDRILLSLLICGMKDCLSMILLMFVFGALFGINGVWLGFCIAPVLSLGVSALLIRLFYGKQKFPLLLEQEETVTASFDLYLEEQAIVDTRDQVEQLLKEHQICQSTILQCMLLVEELGMLIKERNPKKKILAECTVMISDSVQIIFRDDGILFDITDADGPVSSLRSYVVATMMEFYSHKSHLVTTSFNRNMFRFPKQEEGITEF